MKNIKNGKGITLVALVVTIVILLILAVVAVAGIQNKDLITYVEDAVGKHSTEKDKEDGILGSYTEIIDKYLGEDIIGNTIECTHPGWYGTLPTPNGDGTHTCSGWCPDCEVTFVMYIEDCHDDDYKDGLCDGCGEELIKR